MHSEKEAARLLLYTHCLGTISTNGRGNNRSIYIHCLNTKVKNQDDQKFRYGSNCRRHTNLMSPQQEAIYIFNV